MQVSAPLTKSIKGFDYKISCLGSDDKIVHISALNKTSHRSWFAEVRSVSTLGSTIVFSGDKLFNIFQGGIGVTVLYPTAVPTTLKSPIQISFSIKFPILGVATGSIELSETDPLQVMHLQIIDLQENESKLKKENEKLQTTIDTLQLRMNKLETIVFFPKVGYSPRAKHYFKLNKYLWLCSVHNNTGKTWENLWSACNEAEGFHLVSVGPMTVLGKPKPHVWKAACDYFLALGYNYVVTGQPVRDRAWSDWFTGFSGSGGGLGYISLNEGINTICWNNLVDGNSSDKRFWLYANEPSQNRVVTLCMNALHIPGAYVFNHIWRLH